MGKRGRDRTVKVKVQVGDRMIDIDTLERARPPRRDLIQRMSKAI